MSAAVLLFRSKAEAERDALIAQARANYESIFPTARLNSAHTPSQARINLIRKRDNYKSRIADRPVRDTTDDLMMDHADPCYSGDETGC